jgi:hypothetical protein
MQEFESRENEALSRKHKVTFQKSRDSTTGWFMMKPPQLYRCETAELGKDDPLWRGL